MSPKVTRTNIRPLTVIAERMALDPAAMANVSAFIRVVLKNFCAMGLPVTESWELARKHNCKTSQDTVGISLPKVEMRRFKRYAKASGDQKFGALVHSALCNHYLPEAAEAAPAIAA